VAAPDGGRPVGDDEADAAFAPLLARSRVALAVSGGADSTALLLLAAAWRARRADAPELHVLTVNHGLRAASVGETREVERLARKLGLPCHVLAWSGEKPRANRQAAARAARKDLCVEACHALGAETLVLAHHLDDQAETFLLRLARGSGVYGLAAMARTGCWTSGDRRAVEVFRPLLAVPRVRLVATCRVAGVAWAEDPSNLDPAYARTRIRTLMPSLAVEGLDADTLARTAMRLGSVVDALDGLVEEAFARHVAIHPAGPLRVPVAALAGLPREIMLRLLVRLLAEAGGASYPPRLERLERLAEGLAAAISCKFTLSGTVVRRRGAEIFLWREAGRRGVEPLDVAGPGRFVFDGRFELRIDGPVALEVAPLGSLAASPFDRSACGDWPVAAFAAAPVLRLCANAAYCPGLGGTLPEGVALARIRQGESLRRRELAPNPFDAGQI
jgi:tRNA(Ile)-lysidine synthase